MNSLFDEEIRGHHSMRDHLLTVISDADLDYKMPGQNPTLGGLLVEMGDLQGVYTHSFETFTLDWAHRRLSVTEPVTVAGLRAWFDGQDDAMKRALDRFAEDELRVDRIDRGSGFIASPFVHIRCTARPSTSSTASSAQRAPQGTGTRRRRSLGRVGRVRTARIQRFRSRCPVGDRYTAHVARRVRSGNSRGHPAT